MLLEAVSHICSLTIGLTVCRKKLLKKIFLCRVINRRNGKAVSKLTTWQFCGRQERKAWIPSLVYVHRVPYYPLLRCTNFCFQVDLLYQNFVSAVFHSLLLSRILFVNTELCFHIDNAILIISCSVRTHFPWSAPPEDSVIIQNRHSYSALSSCVAYSLWGKKKNSHSCMTSEKEPLFSRQ
jgi:hypothetical protein